MDFFKELFFERSSFVRSLNAIFLVLIPKKGGAKDLKDFRPIGRVVSKIVYDFQHARVEVSKPGTAQCVEPARPTLNLCWAGPAHAC